MTQFLAALLSLFTFLTLSHSQSQQQKSLTLQFSDGVSIVVEKKSNQRKFIVFRPNQIIESFPSLTLIDKDSLNMFDANEKSGMTTAKVLGCVAGGVFIAWSGVFTGGASWYAFGALGGFCAIGGATTAGILDALNGLELSDEAIHAIKESLFSEVVLDQNISGTLQYKESSESFLNNLHISIKTLEELNLN